MKKVINKLLQLLYINAKKTNEDDIDPEPIEKEEYDDPRGKEEEEEEKED